MTAIDPTTLDKSKGISPRDLAYILQNSAIGDNGLAYKGTVTDVPGANQFTIPTIAGLGAGKFDGATNPYAAFVFRKATGTGAAPQGEVQQVTAYTDSTGTFTTAAFTVPVAVGDEILIIHPSISNAVAMPVGLAAVLAIITQTTGLCYQGVVTAIPGANQFTIPSLLGLGAGKFIDLGGVNSYYAFVFRDGAGGSAPPQGEYQRLTHYATATGNFTALVFTVPVDIGDEILIIHPFLARIMNFAGIPGTNGNLAANWQAAEQTLCTIGAPLTRLKVHNLTIGIAALVGNISIRLYTDVNGVERRIYPIPAATTFSMALDGPAIPVINSSVGFKNAVRVTLQSDAVADNGVVAEYDYLTEAM